MESLLTLTAPLPEMVNQQNGKLRVNAYDVRSPFESVDVSVKQKGRTIKTGVLKPISPWSWESDLNLPKPGTYEIALTGLLQNGQ